MKKIAMIIGILTVVSCTTVKSRETIITDQVNSLEQTRTSKNRAETTIRTINTSNTVEKNREFKCLN